MNKYQDTNLENNIGLSSLIEAVLFSQGSPVSIPRLAKLFKKNKEEVLDALGKLEDELSGRGISLVKKEDKVMLASAPEAGEIIKDIFKEDLSSEVGKAGLETLSIILYMSPVSRKDIDNIRGVNSSYILRNLLIKGLIEKDNDDNSRGFLYKPTFQLMSYLGIEKIEDLPDYKHHKEEIENLNKNGVEEEK